MDTYPFWGTKLAKPLLSENCSVTRTPIERWESRKKCPLSWSLDLYDIVVFSDLGTSRANGGSFFSADWKSDRQKNFCQNADWKSDRQKNFCQNIDWKSDRRRNFCQNVDWKSDRRRNFCQNADWKSDRRRNFCQDAGGTSLGNSSATTWILVRTAQAKATATTTSFPSPRPAVRRPVDHGAYTSGRQQAAGTGERCRRCLRSLQAR